MGCIRSNGLDIGFTYHVLNRGQSSEVGDRAWNTFCAICVCATRPGQELGPRGGNLVANIADLSAERGSDRFQNGLVAVFRDVGGIDLDDQAPCPIL
jgi:hypothetical protein